MNEPSHPAWRRPTARRACKTGVLIAAAAGLIGCAQQPYEHHARSREYFSSKVYGKASPRMIADGRRIPRGGGVYLVGHPYTIAGRTYYPRELEHYAAVGMASWYGDAFQGRRTANGEVYDKNSISAAHPTMPLPSYARVTNLGNGRSIIVRVNDRGPYHSGRVMDVSSRVADALEFKGAGTARVKVEYVGRAPLEGSDDNMLMASLRTDGAPASLGGSPVMVATNTVLAPVERLASALTSPVESPRPRRHAPPPAPAPEPEQVALAAEPIRPVPVDAPTPPARPFDLGTIPGAAIPVSFVSAAVLPPRRPSAHQLAADALYFADNNEVRQFLDRKGPFARLKAERVVPLNSDR